MNVKAYSLNSTRIAEIIKEETIIENAQDGLDLLGDVYYQGFDSVILYEKSITPVFFDLKSGIAGEILQKFSTYGVRLAIVGDFYKYESKSLSDFIYESNKGRQINFLASREDALKILSSK